MASRILLIEDDESIGSSLEEALTAHGHTVDWRQSGSAGLEALRRGGGAEVVLLDLGLPDLDGIEVCRQLRTAAPELAIVMLTARSDDADVVVGLNAGADDYIAKPFGLAVLLARVEAQERRRQRRQGASGLRAGALRIDGPARRAVLDGDELALTVKEFDLLTLLVTEQGRAVTREHIIDTVWDEHWHGSTKTLDMHVLTLRRKLANGDADAPRITTLRGVGYRLDLR